MVVHAVRGSDPHAGAYLAKSGRIAPVVDRLLDEVQNHLLTLREPLHRGERLLNARSIVNKRGRR